LEPYRPRVVSPGSGWERPCVLATGSKFEIVYWERIESPVPAVLKELNGSPLPSATERSGVAPLSKEWAPWRWWRPSALVRIDRVSQSMSVRSVVLCCSTHL
jgi:hypothetical protein